MDGIGQDMMKTTPTPGDILPLICEQAGVLKARFAVRKIGLFGSTIRGEARPDSDVDVLVEFEVPTFDHYMDLKFYLEELFNRPVDLVTIASLKPRLRESILREVRYAA